MTKSNLLKVGLWSRFIKDIKLLYALSKDYWKGEYRDVSLWSISIFILAIIYILSPLDILSDFIPVLGQIDDAAVLLLCLYFLEKDLVKYEAWKISRTAQRDSD